MLQCSGEDAPMEHRTKERENIFTYRCSITAELQMQYMLHYVNFGTGHATPLPLSKGARDEGVFYGGQTIPF